MSKRNYIFNISTAPECSGLLYLPYSILVEISKETNELLPDGIGSAPGAPDNDKVDKVKC